MAAPIGPKKVHRYTVEFKIQAVRLSLHPDIQTQDVAKALDIHPFMLSKWKKDYREGMLKPAAATAGLSLPAARPSSGTLGSNFHHKGGRKADVISLGKPGLFAIAAKQAGSRVLDGRILAEQVGMGVPKGRNAAAAAYVGKFVEEAKAEGLVKSAIERAGLRGVVVAPLK